MPWEFLRAARDRGTALSLVLNRVPEDAGREVPAHLRQMLEDEGLPEADVLVVPETTLAEDLLPASALTPVRAWLDDLAADAQARAALVRRTLRGALASLPARSAAVEGAVVEQLSAAAELRAEADAAYTAAGREVEVALRSGSLLRGEVLARWHEVVGTGDVMRTLETRVGWARDRLWSLVSGKPAADGELREAVENRVEAVVRAAAERAAERTARAWRERVAGQALLAGKTGLDRASAGLEAATEDEVRAWQSRPLESLYPIIYLDAIMVKIRDGAHVSKKAIYLVIGVNLEGIKEVLGMWIANSEGAKFWLAVMTELRNRGVEDIFIACVDGLKGMPEAIEAVYPQAEVQQCIVHMLRQSLKYVHWKQRKPPSMPPTLRKPKVARVSATSTVRRRGYRHSPKRAHG